MARWARTWASAGSRRGRRYCTERVPSISSIQTRITTLHARRRTRLCCHAVRRLPNFRWAWLLPESHFISLPAATLKIPRAPLGQNSKRLIVVTIALRTIPRRTTSTSLLALGLRPFGLRRLRRTAGQTSSYWGGRRGRGWRKCGRRGVARALLVDSFGLLSWNDISV